MASRNLDSPNISGNSEVKMSMRCASLKKGRKRGNEKSSIICFRFHIYVARVGIRDGCIVYVVRVRLGICSVVVGGCGVGMRGEVIPRAKKKEIKKRKKY